MHMHVDACGFMWICEGQKPALILFLMNALHFPFETVSLINLELAKYAMLDSKPVLGISLFLAAQYRVYKL